MSDLFISYSTKDIQFVRDITPELDNHGITYWLAPEILPNEDQFGGQIIKGIRGADIFLVLISSASQKSGNVMHELSYADKENKYIIPFFVEDCKVTDEFEYYLAGKSPLHAEKKFVDAVNRLVSIILYLKEHDFPQKPRHIRCPQCGSSTMSEHVDSHPVLRWILRIVFIFAIVFYLYFSLVMSPILVAIDLLVTCFMFDGRLSSLMAAPKIWMKMFRKLLMKVKCPLSTKYWYLRCNDCKHDFAVKIDVEDRRKDMILELVPIQETKLLENSKSIQCPKE